MSFDLSAILKFLTRAILKLVQERLARNAGPEPAIPAPPPPTVPTVEAKAALPSDRVLAAVVDLKLGPGVSKSAQTDVGKAAAALATTRLVDDVGFRRQPTGLAASPGAEREGIRQAAIETQENWRSKRILAALAEQTGAGLPGTTPQAGPLMPAPAASPTAATELSQAGASLNAALRAYRALETA